MGPTHPRMWGATLPPVGAASLLPAALVVAMVWIAIALSGCGGGGGTGSTGAGGSSGSEASGAQSTDAVTIHEYEYEPASIAVPVGTVVRFTNRDSTPHTVTSKQSGVFESGPIDTGKTGQIKLEKAGTYAFYCAFHPFMKGTIEVE